jgi:hypothetical protein
MNILTDYFTVQYKCVLYLMTKYPKKSCSCSKSEMTVTEVLAPASVEEIINMLNLNMLERCPCVA